MYIYIYIYIILIKKKTCTVEPPLTELRLIEVSVERGITRLKNKIENNST